jgi:glycosyltransferase involved in cell wall biosynthesis
MPDQSNQIELDVHMGYRIFDIGHGGGWVGKIKFARLLAARGVHWTIWCFATDPEGLSEFEGMAIRLVQTPSDSRQPGGDHPVIAAAIKAAMTSRANGRASLVLPGSWGWRSLKMLWLARLRNVKFALDGQIMPDALPAAGWRRFKLLWSQRVLMSPVSHFFALTQELRRAYRQRFLLRDNQVLTTPNGVDLERFRPASTEEKQELRAALGLPVKGPLILFCGSIIRRKGVDLLLKAWAEVQRSHPEAVLVLRGSIGQRPSFRSESMAKDQDTFTEDIDRLQKDLPHPEGVIFAGHGTDVESYYRAADLFVFPSRLEGLPYVLIEAMSCGLPCIIAPFEGIPKDGEELGQSGKHFLPCTHEPDSIAAELIKALDHPAQAKGLGMAARRWMEQTQDLEKVADIWALAYRKAAGL